jgi:transcriptional regulator with XRE-family HTH domain
VAGHIPGIIKKYRTKKGYTQKQVAEFVGKSKNAISNWETGLNEPSIDELDWYYFK